MSILLCSFDKALRERWAKILGEVYQIREIGSGAELHKIMKGGDVDLILLHRSLVDFEYISTLKSLPFVVLADRPDDSEAVSVLRSGALSYTNSYVSEPRLLEIVKVALAGRVWINQGLLQRIIRGTGTKSEIIASHEILTGREIEVAQLVSKGLSNLEIAAELDISDRTVKAHMGSIFKKTHTSSRLQLALYMKNLLAEKQDSGE